jgi:4-hydroxy-4-methyl-2-oxoglutarate aldolase
VLTTSHTSVIGFLESVDSPTLANAIETCGVRENHEGFTPLEIRPLFPELGRLCGYAVTAHVETISRTEPADNARFLDLYEAVERSPKPAVIAFQEIGANPNFSAHCGEVMATIFTRLGARGLVTDSAVRDIPEVRALRFQYFARGSVASHAHFRIVRVGVPVQILGMTVRPGDLLHGDENGLLQVPEAALGRLPDAVASIRERERELMDYVRGPQFTLSGLRGRIVE